MIETASIEFVKGVGTRRAELLLSELGVRTVEDMLYVFPYRYVDRSKFYMIADCVEGMPYIQIRGWIVSFERKGEGRSQRLAAVFTDGVSYMELVWFKGIKYVEGNLKTNFPYIVFGKPTLFGSKFNMAHPDVVPYTEGGVERNVGWQGFYNTSEKMKNKFLNSTALRNILISIFFECGVDVKETLPDYLVKQYALMSRSEALRVIHFPQNIDILNRAKRRLKFEELFYIQLSILRGAKLRDVKYGGFVFSRIGDFFNGFYSKNLPFPLTAAQKRVLREIRSDVGSGRQMNRLLQGDVGSGKTIVALMSCLMALDNGYQAAIMAPTEILANQHFEGISAMVEGLNIRVGLLTGSTRKKARAEIHENLESGQLHILIGTHALIEDNVKFANLGLVVIDEQHRFGVAQRAKLWTKNVCPPHILVMTATPIPRTLAMTVYGDLEVSVIDELPPGRKPIATYHYFDNARDRLNNFIGAEIRKGRQVYVVFPLIEESEKLDFKNLETGYQHLQEVFPNFSISIVHGKMKAAEKDAAMRRFVEGKTQIMVATTVIEVGVNVPNASVMVIESAERFGLSQLHQLRGRVGRGAEQSYCILMSSYQISNDTRKRLSIMVDSTDGFVIAEADMNLRGPGDIDGTAQSGMPFDLKIANLSTDGVILTAARNIARDVLADDPMLEKEENRVLLARLKLLQREVINWGVIS